MVAMTSLAYSHPWTGSDIVIGTSGTSTYTASGYIYATEAFDFGAVSIMARQGSDQGQLVAMRESMCGSESLQGHCPTHYVSRAIHFPQATHVVTSQNCAYDGNHQLHPTDYGQGAGICAGKNVDFNEITVY